MHQDTETQQRDYGTPELHQRHIIEIEDKTARIRTSVPIDYYRHQGWITLKQWEAGELLYTLWYYGAEKSSFVTIRDPRLPRGNCDPSRRDELEQRYNQAMRAITHLATALIIYNVVCIGEWARSDAELYQLKLTDKKHYLDALEEKIGKNRRMKLLREGLDCLAEHFGIPG